MVMSFLLVASAVLSSLANCGVRNKTLCTELSICTWNEATENCEGAEQICAALEEPSCAESPQCMWNHNKCQYVWRRPTPDRNVDKEFCESDKVKGNSKKARFCCRKFGLKCSRGRRPRYISKELCGSDMETDNFGRNRLCCERYQLRCSSVDDFCESDKKTDEFSVNQYCCGRLTQTATDTTTTSTATSTTMNTATTTGSATIAVAAIASYTSTSTIATSTTMNTATTTGSATIAEAAIASYTSTSTIATSTTMNTATTTGSATLAVATSTATTTAIASYTSTSTIATSTTSTHRCKLAQEAYQMCVGKKTLEACAASSGCIWWNVSCRPSDGGFVQIILILKRPLSEEQMGEDSQGAGSNYDKNFDSITEDHIKSIKSTDVVSSLPSNEEGKVRPMMVLLAVACGVAFALLVYLIVLFGRRSSKPRDSTISVYPYENHAPNRSYE